jgi:hypothetical protein
MHLQKVRRRPRTEHEYASLEDRFYALVAKPAEAILLSTEFNYNVFFHDTEDFVNASSQRAYRVKEVRQWPGYMQRILHKNGYTQRIAEYLG